MSGRDDLQTGLLNEPGAALGSYLDALLREPEAEAREAVSPETVPAQQPQSPPETEQDATAEPESTSLESDGLAVLLLGVKGVTLAVPRQYVAAVYGREEAAEACMGTVSLRDVVFPEGHPLRAGEDDSGCVVALTEGGWGLFCDAVSGEATVREDAVKSAGAGRSRPWLAGMIAEPRCWLVDVPALLSAAEEMTSAG